MLSGMSRKSAGILRGSWCVEDERSMSAPLPAIPRHLSLGTSQPEIARARAPPVLSL
jgi:hypothetical protein